MGRLRWLHSGERNAETHVALLHGFGANARDLAGIAPSLDPEGRFAFHFPEAPVELFQDARAWCPADPAEAERALSGTLWRDLPGYDSPSIDDALGALLQDLDALGLAGEQLLLGGFSQGSMMALLAGLSRPCSGIILFSSALFAETRLATLLASPPRMPVFMGHGTADPLLPYGSGVALRDLFAGRGMDVEFHTFDGGHWVDEGEAAAASRFIGRIAAAQ